jgi:hypothetical protein
MSSPRCNKQRSRVDCPIRTRRAISHLPNQPRPRSMLRRSSFLHRRRHRSPLQRFHQSAHRRPRARRPRPLRRRRWRHLGSLLPRPLARRIRRCSRFRPCRSRPHPAWSPGTQPLRSSFCRMRRRARASRWRRQAILESLHYHCHSMPARKPSSSVNEQTPTWSSVADAAWPEKFVRAVRPDRPRLRHQSNGPAVGEFRRVSSRFFFFDGACPGQRRTREGERSDSWESPWCDTRIPRQRR